MKKVISVFIFLLLCVSISQAQQLIGGRAAGMGGAGVAATDDLSAAYYNPAALMRSKVIATEVKVDLGAAYTSPDTLSSALSNSSDPSKFMIDNYHKNLSFNGSLNGLVGINLRKIGISVVPILTATVNKPAESLGGTMEATGHYDTTLTLGTTFSVPYLPAALDVGLNLKSINGINGSITSTQSSTNTFEATGTQTYGTGSGTGFDLGVLTSFNVPYVTKVAVGAVVRNLAASYALSNTSKTAHMNFLTQTTTFGADVVTNQTVNLDSSTAVGAYTVIPGLGLGVAADLEMTKTDTNTHLGLEYPMFLNTLILRAGVASGPNLSLTTAGAELNLKVFKLGLVTVADGKNTGLTNTIADISFGL
jgi:hypothetical protein